MARITVADGRHDAAGNIAIEQGDSEYTRLRSKGLKPDEYAAFVVWNVLYESTGSLGDVLHTAMSETPNDAEAIAEQVRAYYAGFFSTARGVAEQAIAFVEEDE